MEPKGFLRATDQVTRSPSKSIMSLPRLTRHQREVLDRLTRLSRDGRWVEYKYIGSRGAIAKLVEKGYVERSVRYGPRGGQHHVCRPTVR